jgi:menaquinone-dependent protoporphyrinogen oxidase
LKIFNAVKEVLIENNNTVELFSIEDFKSKIIDFEEFIVEESIRYEKHSPPVEDSRSTHS